MRRLVADAVTSWQVFWRTMHRLPFQICESNLQRPGIKRPPSPLMNHHGVSFIIRPGSNVLASLATCSSLSASRSLCFKRLPGIRARQWLQLTPNLRLLFCPRSLGPDTHAAHLPTGPGSQPRDALRCFRPGLCDTVVNRNLLRPLVKYYVYWFLLNII